MSDEQQQAEALVDEDRLLNHSYDGIQEYDNPLPFWWVGIFVACIIFSAGYWVYYHMGGGGLHMHAVYQMDEAEYTKTREAFLAKQLKVTLPLLAKLSTDQDALAKSKVIFIEKCSACHLKDGGGLVGPNMTDDYQLHGTTRLDLYTTIRDGKPAKGMQSWAPVLTPLEMARMAAYVSNLRGTKPAKGKAPQGKIVPPYGSSLGKAAPAKADAKGAAPKAIEAKATETKATEVKATTTVKTEEKAAQPTKKVENKSAPAQPKTATETKK